MLIPANLYAIPIQKEKKYPEKQIVPERLPDAPVSSLPRIQMNIGIDILGFLVAVSKRLDIITAKWREGREKEMMEAFLRQSGSTSVEAEWWMRPGTAGMRVSRGSR